MNTHNFFNRIPKRMKSLHEMDNELRNAARKGFVLGKEEAAEHLARGRHLQHALDEAKGLELHKGPQIPLRKEGEA
jgi:hypothetical protein